MNLEQLQRFEAAVVAAIEQYLADGGKLLHSRFIDFDGAKCPIVCWLGDSNNTPLFMLATRALGFVVEDYEIWNFIHGFDLRRPYNGDDTSPTYKLGQQLRRKYLP